LCAESISRKIDGLRVACSEISEKGLRYNSATFLWAFPGIVLRDQIMPASSNRFTLWRLFTKATRAGSAQPMLAAAKPRLRLKR